MSEDNAQPRANPEPRNYRSGAVVAGRIRTIASLMSRGDWERGITSETMAEEWGLAHNTVQQYAAEARRYLDFATSSGNLEEIERFCRMRLREIAEADGPDRVAAITTTLKNIGRLTDKHEVKVEAVPTPELLSQAMDQILDDPELRGLLLEKLRERALNSPEIVALLTTGETISEGIVLK